MPFVRASNGKSWKITFTVSGSVGGQVYSDPCSGGYTGTFEITVDRNGELTVNTVNRSASISCDNGGRYGFWVSLSAPTLSNVTAVDV